MAQNSKADFRCSDCSGPFLKLNDFKSHFKNFRNFSLIDFRATNRCKIGCTKKSKNLRNMYAHLEKSHIQTEINDVVVQKYNSQKSLWRMVANLRTLSNAFADAAIDEFILESDRHTR